VKSYFSENRPLSNTVTDSLSFAFREEFSQNATHGAQPPHWRMLALSEANVKRPAFNRVYRPHLVTVCVLLTAIAVVSESCGKIGKPDDAAITTDIKAKMFSEPSLKSASVDVSSRGGEVTLTGQVPDDSARLAAYKIASEAKGVTKVNDQMMVPAAQAAAAAPAATKASDSSASPTTEAKSADPAPKAKPPARKTPKPKPAATDDMAAGAAGAGTPVTSTEAVPPAPVAQQAAATPPPPQPQPRTVTVPSGAIITVRTIDAVDSSVNKTGQVFKASLDAPIVLDDRVIVPKGADAYIKLVNASSAGKFAGKSELTLDLQSVVFQGRTYNVSTSDVQQAGKSRGKDSAVKIGGGAALGALIGGVAGGGKGAAIGAAVGGGAGTGVQVFTKGKQVKIPSETRLDFTLQQPFDITYIPGRKSQRSSPDQSSGQPDAAPNAASDQPPLN
jgi:BON domain-containing protein